MSADTADALRAAASEGDGVDFDGLRATRGADGYAFETDERSLAGLSPDEFVEEAAGDPYVDNWHYWERVVRGHGTPRRAFLRWLERADERPVPERYDALSSGTSRGWGELRVTVERDGDERRYGFRHADDAEASLDDLDVRTDPLAAREVTTFDEKGHYRPLKTAPSLQSGWAFADLTGEGLVRALDFVYPATIANWHREREGDLDVTHYRETAERQTGIYDLIENLDPEAVADLAAACCADSQCLKRREWDESADEPLDVPRGDGEFPCREPCSLFVAAARTVTIAEGEEPREYTFELTPTEKNQLEEILDAVADGRIDDIREADLRDGANRYRARYLREKRLTDRGLCDVPTTGDED